MKTNQFRDNLIANLIFLIFFSIVVYAAVVSPILSSGWKEIPFLGGFLGPELNFKLFKQLLPEDEWQANDRGLGMETHLVAIDAVKIASIQDVQHYLSTKDPDQSVMLTVRSQQRSENIQVRLGEFSSTDYLLYFLLPYIAGLVSLVCSVWALSDHRKHASSMAYALLAASFALILFTQFDFFTTHQLVTLHFTGIAMAAGSFFQAAFLLPDPKQKKPTSPWLGLLGYPINLLLVGLAVFQLNNETSQSSLFTLHGLLFISLTISTVFFIIKLNILRSETLSPLLERQSETLLGATVISVFPFTLHLVVSAANATEPLTNPLMFISLALLPVTFSLLRRPYSLPQTKQNIYRAVVTILTTLIFGGAYGFFIYLTNLTLVAPIAPDNPYLLGAMIFLTVLIFKPLQKRIEGLLNINPERDNAIDINLALEYSERLSAAENMTMAIRVLHDAIVEIIQPKHLYVFLYDPEQPGYSAFQLDHYNAEGLSLPSDSNLASTLKEYRQSIYLENESLLDKNFADDADVLKKMDPRLFVPISGSFALLGWVVLGNKAKENHYTVKDIHLIESLASHFALIYERSDSIQSTNRRLQEMEVLNQIAIAINNSNDIDQILLTVFQFLQRLFQINAFSLVMETASGEGFQRQFLYENEKVVISSKAPQVLRDDFPEKQAILSGESTLQHNEISSWMIIPLQTETRIIGALRLETSKDLATFNRANLNLCDSIANLVTGALIKTNLLQSTQTQAQQLAELNKVSRQLTSTLVFEELLQTIVESAMEILNSSSGALLVLDKTTNELVVEVVAGEAKPTIIGKRIPINHGIAGESYTSCEPLILNRHYPDETEEDIPSSILDLPVETIITFPLMSQGEIIGVLEIINKNNGQIFTESDLQILESFAGQASIALNNARLYTKTDQALEDRVEQLSTIQNIDRELHSSHKIDEALQATLRGAVNHTGAICGTIALVDTFNHTIENIWQVTPGSEQPASLEDMDLKDFIWFSKDSEEPYQVIQSSVSELTEMLNLPLPCEVHFLIQANLEDQQYALLILHLETMDKLTDQDIDFLVRLNEHASIALRNALLYEDLQDAIQSKNEFISFISHELKNPLTAIKGHADILAKGMVGEINKEQEDFLRTISHNVRRMTTFITDLADQSHIESKSLRFTFSAEAVEDLVDEVLQSYAQNLREKSLTIDAKLTKPLPQVWCDRQRLIQVLSNLVSNAIKYTPDGGKIEVGAEYAINNWDQEGAAEVVHFWVKDNGYGIAEEDQSHLFEKFYRGTDESILKIPGTGLGLRISKSLTEMMGGTMWFESAQGDGSTFHFTIPI